KVVLKAGSFVNLTFPWAIRRLEMDPLDLCKVLESFVRCCPGLPVNLKAHIGDVQTEIIERVAWEEGSTIFSLI
ncbi:unnamed protein product, partial [Discosporangium mesarthrocarpum]